MPLVICSDALFSALVNQSTITFLSSSLPSTML
uniref:Uncharacterized protein n=1 Tax=Arundo donax TaxID=35708 RepID=A0A0A9T8E0_ARUDO